MSKTRLLYTKHVRKIEGQKDRSATGLPGGVPSSIRQHAYV